VAGASSDHEAVLAEEASEKLSLGFHVMLRYGSGAQALHLLPALLNPYCAEHISLVSDDLSARDLVGRGHLDEALRRAVALGVEPLMAVKTVTLNPARHFGLTDSGAVAPGLRADLVTVADLESFAVRRVVKAGRLVYENGRLRERLPAPAPVPEALRHSFHCRRVEARDFLMPAREGDVEVIGLVPGQILTRLLRLPVSATNGHLAASAERDLAKVAVIERHKGSGRIGLGLVRGFGLRRGAFGTSFSHDAHNLVVVGVSDEDMARVANRIIAMGGGIAATCGEALWACLPLPIAGLLSPGSALEVSSALTALEAVLGILGVSIPRPLTALSFLTLAVVPEARVTDWGPVRLPAAEGVPW
jgi:adenine deaminase